MAAPRNSKDANLVTRMLRSINVGSDSYDFDDVLHRFERRFGANYLRRDSGEKSEDENSGESVNESSSEIAEPDQESLVQITLRDFEGEFEAFFASFCRIAHSRSKMEGSCTVGENFSVLISKSAFEVSRQVLGRELRLYTERLAEIDFFLSGGHENSVSLGHRATVASLKRQLRESSEELERVLRLTKRRDIDSRKLREQLDQLVDERDNARAKSLGEIEEKERLRARVSSMKHIVEESTHENKHLYYQKQRLERTIGVLRKELLETHHDRDTLRLELDLLKSRAEELARRGEESRKGESIIVAKVRDLQLIQQEMVEHMTQIGQGNHRARGALDALSAKRTKLLGRIVTLMANRDDAAVTPDGSTSAPGGSAATPSVRAHDGSTSRLDESQKMTTFLGGFTGSASGSGQADRPPDRARADASPRALGMGALQRKMTRMIRPFSHGNFSGRAGTSGFASSNENSERIDRDIARDSARGNVRESARGHRNAVRYAGARAHGAAISDLVALREVIELKEKEIHRMEKELEKTRGRADGFELELHVVRQTQRKENRNLGGAELTETLKLMHNDRESHNLHNTMFDWANNPAPGDGERTTKVPTPVDEDLYDDDVDMKLSPISEKAEPGDEIVAIRHIDSASPEFH